MKTIGRNGSSSEYTVFNANNFIHKGEFYDRKSPAQAVKAVKKAVNQ